MVVVISECTWSLGSSAQVGSANIRRASLRERGMEASSLPGNIWELERGEVLRYQKAMAYMTLDRLVIRHQGAQTSERLFSASLLSRHHEALKSSSPLVTSVNQRPQELFWTA